MQLQLYRIRATCCIDETVVMPSAMGFLVFIPSTGQVKCYVYVF